MYGQLIIIQPFHTVYFYQLDHASMSEFNSTVHKFRCSCY